MRAIWNYIRQHIRIDFHPGHYTFIFIFLTVCIYFNFKFDFEDSFLDAQHGIPKFIYYFLTNLFAYLVPVFSYTFFYKDQKALKSREFWIKSILAIALLSFDRGAFFIEEIADALVHHRVQHWMAKVLNNVLGIFTMILPLFLLYMKYDQDQQNWYGLAPKKFDPKPYITMLGLMLPLIIAASFLPSFQHQYPMYGSPKAHLQWGVPEWVTVSGYEIAYALNFVSIEFFFRGFLILGMLSLLGRGAILPMACVYCFLHFGKPMGEAISSIFGGYILGVIAYETRSVWGGIIVHVGIAWMMELVAFIQKSFSLHD